MLQIAKRRRVELHRERLIEDREKIRIFVEAIRERSVGKQLLYEARANVALSTRIVADVMGLRVVPGLLAFVRNGEQLTTVVGYSRRRRARSDAVDVFSAYVVLLIG